MVTLPLELRWETGRSFGKHGIFVGENPLEKPPLEIVAKGKQAVILYFKSLEQPELQALNEVKVLLIGDPGAGKTSLVRQIFGEKFNTNESQTHGINIRDWRVRADRKHVSVHFWDFGGQEIMHATHQFFLSKRSLYILVLDGRKEEDAEYWLKHIESFGGDSPILIVLNKMDQNPGFDVNRRFLLDKYKGIKRFHRVSCAEGTRIREFVMTLTKEIVNVEIIKTTWAKSWFNVKTQLEHMSDNFISYDRYKHICVEEGITEQAAQDALVDFLNDLGVMLHFRDFKLLDTYVLEPKWVKHAVYRIITSKRLSDAKGVLNLGLLGEILKKKKRDDFHYPVDKFPFIIELMKKFELCYEIDDNSVLIPDLLEIQEPEIKFDYDKSLRFLIEYDFLPRSVVPRFIVRMHKDIKGHLRWRTGVLLHDRAFKSTAVVKADERDKKIYIYVNGDQRRDYFAVVRYAFLSINNSFEKLLFTEKVPMPDSPTITVSYSHLATLERMGVEQYIPDGSEKQYNVKDLLGTIFVEKKTEQEILQILKKIRTQTDTPKSLSEKVNEMLLLQPNFFGMGINLNALIKKLFKKAR
ncbi:MAG: COR domain-containing protein [Planctomycetota bacterium]